MRDQVLVLNYHDAASRAVTRKLRAERVLAKIVPGSASMREILSAEPLGLILAGDTEGRVPAIDPQIFSSGLPVLALGDTALSLLRYLGGQIGETAAAPGMGRLSCPAGSVFSCLEGTERMLPALPMLTLPAGTEVLCTADGAAAGFGCRDKMLYGAPFQVEAVDPDGAMLLRDFALNICCCTTWWDDEAFVDRAVEEIRRIVGGGRAACALTGGLDSGVSAMLAFRALGASLKCLFVDTGLMREKEAESVAAYYRDEIGLDVVCVSAGSRFMDALKGVTDPGEKRRVIGETLQAVLDEERPRLGHYDVLIRGTSYNDIMFAREEIRPCLDAAVPVIEPVRELFKDEIRRVGDFMGIPGDLMSRQAFPGSGLALRILGEATPQRLAVLRRADAIFRSEVQRFGAAKRLWQYFAVLCPMPEDETGSVICLRAVHASEQSMAYVARLPYDVTEAATERILRELPQVRRVVYDLTPSSRYAGIEWQ